MKTVDPKTRTLLDLIAALGEPPPGELPIEEFRLRRARGRDLVNAPFDARLAVIEDATIAGGAGPLKARIYDAQDGAARPTLLYFHGGGFCYGDIESHDPICRRLAVHGGFRVVSVDYRLAPEHRYPSAVEDASAALSDLAVNAARFGADPARLAVGGDSAGACLATIAARRAARSGGPALRFQLLIYPVTQSGRMTASRETYAEGYFLTRPAMDWFEKMYLTDAADRDDETVSPLYAPIPSGTAPALVITAGFDPLLDEGRAYAEALAAAGVAAGYVDYPDQIHGFFSFTAFSSAAEEAIRSSAKAVARALAP